MNTIPSTTGVLSMINSQKGVQNGVAPLDANKKIPVSYLDNLEIDTKLASISKPVCIAICVPSNEYSASSGFTIDNSTVCNLNAPYACDNIDSLENYVVYIMDLNDLYFVVMNESKVYKHWKNEADFKKPNTIYHVMVVNDASKYMSEGHGIKMLVSDIYGTIYPIYDLNNNQGIVTPAAAHQICTKSGNIKLSDLQSFVLTNSLTKYDISGPNDKILGVLSTVNKPNYITIKELKEFGNGIMDMSEATTDGLYEQIKLLITDDLFTNQLKNTIIFEYLYTEMVDMPNATVTISNYKIPVVTLSKLTIGINIGLIIEGSINIDVNTKVVSKSDTIHKYVATWSANNTVVRKITMVY